MTNKELFHKLSESKQIELVKTLANWSKCHIEFYNGEYHITTSFCIRAKYEDDYKVLNEFTQKEFYPNGVDYWREWCEFYTKKEANGEANEIIKLANGNITGKWQHEFEELFEDNYINAIAYFVRS